MNTTQLPAGYGISITLEATPYQFGNALDIINSGDNEMGDLAAQLERGIKISQNLVSVEMLKDEVENSCRILRKTAYKELRIYNDGYQG